jgi:hypothetical protein
MTNKSIFLIYNIIIIIVFTYIYYHLSEEHFYIDYNLEEENQKSLIDCVNLSVTIQSTVGLPSIKAKTKLCRFVVTLQQALLVISLYALFADFF